MRVVAFGGSTDSSSWTEDSLGLVLARLFVEGVDRIDFFGGSDLEFPLYRRGLLNDKSARFIEAIRNADGIVIGSPGYHGTVSGLVKNALDYVEELRGEPRPYFQGLPVGLVSVACSWSAAIQTLGTLREITHSLRGWPTPTGLAINSAEVARIDGLPEWSVHQQRQAELVAEQLVTFSARVSRPQTALVGIR